MKSAPAIEVNGLVKQYGGRRVVDQISFRVDHGEIFGLLGPNGAGKTTTVEILEGLRPRDGGSAAVVGLDSASLRPVDRNRIGVVTQSTADRTMLSVREILRQYAAYYADPLPVDEVIEAVGLAEKATARITTLSGGQRRRVDVALGIIGRPEVLFLDEPTTGFDPAARREFWGLIKRLRERGTTILLTSHYLDEVDYLADRIAIIAAGQLKAIGSTTQIQQEHGAAAIVRWRDATGLHEEPTDTPTALIRRLLPADGELAGLEVRRPTLEETYLKLLEA